jgi:hypothetical protein
MNDADNIKNLMRALFPELKSEEIDSTMQTLLDDWTKWRIYTSMYYPLPSLVTNDKTKLIDMRCFKNPGA